VDLLDKMRDVLKGTPPPWLRKALAKDQQRTHDFEDDDEEMKS
jgi:nitrogen fixation protein NifX